MGTYRGFLYAKLDAMGSKSERSNYYLQVSDDKEFSVTTKGNHPWGPNLKLEPYVNKKIEIEGKINEMGAIVAEDIKNWDGSLG